MSLRLMKKGVGACFKGELGHRPPPPKSVGAREMDLVGGFKG